MLVTLGVTKCHSSEVKADLGECRQLPSSRYGLSGTKTEQVTEQVTEGQVTEGHT